MTSSNAPRPLTPKVLHILMALAAEPMNGYRLAIRVEESSRGAIRLSPGTLYENLHRLAAHGLIADDPGTASEQGDGRGQRFYALTSAGIAALRAEVARLESDIDLARSLPALGF